MKLTKLAFMNVKKSYKDYFIYFLTLMFSVCLFYTFNSFSAQQEILALSEGQEMIMQTTAIMINALSVFIAFVLAFLILYANNFLVKRRKKEFGIYMLLGMPKSQISKVLVYETFFVGVLSLVIGILLGIGCSQLLGILTASMFQVEMNYRIIFSFSSVLMTIVSFGVIFLVVMVFNTRIISKVKLIDLLHAKKMIEKQRILKTWLSLLVLIISLACIGTAYYFATGSLTQFGSMILPIMIIGAIGTILFFVSLSGFLLQFIKRSKRIYYSRLNMFVLRQINAKVNTTSISMSVVCLMLLLSLGAMTTGISLNTGITDTVKDRTPYMYTYRDRSQPQISMKEMQKLLQLNDAAYWNSLATYQDGVTAEALFPYLSEEAKGIMYAKAEIPYIKQSNYNELAKNKNLPEVDAKGVVMICNNETVLDYMKELRNHDANLTINGSLVSIDEVKDKPVFLTTYDGSAVTLIVPDHILNGLLPTETFWNVDLQEDDMQKEYSKQVQSNLETYYSNTTTPYMYTGTTREEISESFYGVGMIFTYIGLYLGVVFLMASAAILALQQLSDAEDNKANYEVLRKIGVSKRMMNHAILSQIGIYFLLPLGLAIVHSLVGIPAVSNGFSTVMGLPDMTKDNLWTSGILIIMYGSYFLATYQGYKAALHK